MTSRFLLPILVALALPLGPVAAADAPDPMAAFHPGTAIPGYGKFADVDADMAIPEGTVLLHSFDVADGKAATLNRSLESVARFVNLHVAAGMPLVNVHAAVVIHGPAVFEVTNAERYGAKYDGAENPNAALVAALLAAGVEIYVCGQSSAAQGVDNDDLLPGVKMALSAMTAHALLQQRGYTLNPF